MLLAAVPEICAYANASNSLYQNLPTSPGPNVIYGVNLQVVAPYPLAALNPSFEPQLQQERIYWARVSMELGPSSKAPITANLINAYRQESFIATLDPQAVQLWFGNNWTLSNWDTYVRAAISNYSFIHVWEVGQPSFIGGYTVQNGWTGYLLQNRSKGYVQMLKDTYNIVKEYNSSDLVLYQDGVSLSMDGDTYIQDYNAGRWNGTPTYTYAYNQASRTSADWIMECPPTSFSSCIPAGGLTNFGTVDFGSDYTGSSLTCYAVIDKVSGTVGSFSDVTEWVLIDGSGNIMALPSSLSVDGTSFSVQYYANS